MQLESPTLLHDVLQAADTIIEFIEGETFDDYLGDLKLRSAVERQFQIIGEALARLSRIDPETSARISDCSRIVSFRNILVHAYAQVNDRIVWGAARGSLPKLRVEVIGLLAEATDIDG
jgi:uncharacterized protein with HEPN domain